MRRFFRWLNVHWFTLSDIFILRPALDTVGSSPARSCGVTESRTVFGWQGRERAEHPCGWQRCGAASLAMRWSLGEGVGRREELRQ